MPETSPWLWRISRGPGNDRRALEPRQRFWWGKYPANVCAGSQLHGCSTASVGLYFCLSTGSRVQPGQREPAEPPLLPLSSPSCGGRGGLGDPAVLFFRLLWLGREVLIALRPPQAEKCGVISPLPSPGDATAAAGCWGPAAGRWYSAPGRDWGLWGVSRGSSATFWLFKYVEILSAFIPML